MHTNSTRRNKAYTFPILLLMPFFLYWLYTGFFAVYMLVWMADAIVNMALLIVLVATYKKFSLSNLSYLLIFIFLMLSQTGIRYSYEFVPYNEWTQSLFGFELNDVFGFQRNQYDRFIHFCYGLLIYFPVYDCMRFAGAPLKPAVKHFITFAIINACSAMYEIIEFVGGYVLAGESVLLYHGMQGDVFDPPKDMAMALVGALVTMGVMLVYDKWKRMIPAIVIFLLTVVTLGAHARTPEDRSADILKKAFERYEANSIYTEMTMHVVRPKWASELRFRAWTKSPHYALVLITDPARESGQTFLKRGGELWHYLPNIEKTVKLSAGLLTNSWMGSDFSIDDVLQNRSFVTDYDSFFIGQALVDGKACHLIELIPKPGLPVVWGKVHTWITTMGNDQVKAAFFDQQGQMVKLMEAFDFTSWQGRNLPARIQMTPMARPENKTILYVTSYIFNQDMDDGFFSLQRMRRIN